jgi:hypothetical protein
MDPSDLVFWPRFQPEPGMSEPVQTLTFGRDFNQSLERVNLPSSLKGLTLGEFFNQSLERVDIWLQL